LILRRGPGKKVNLGKADLQSGIKHFGPGKRSKRKKGGFGKRRRRIHLGEEGLKNMERRGTWKEGKKYRRERREFGYSKSLRFLEDGSG